MNIKLLKDLFGWGLLLWFIGYLLGILLIMFVPSPLIGWVIMPIGVILTLWILFKKIDSKEFKYYLYIALAWTFIAILFDYLFIVKLFNPPDGYYKLDVYLYYLFTFVIPVMVGLKKASK